MPRRSLAEGLLAGGHASEAVEEAKRVLRSWPEDGVTLHVLAAALATSDRTRAAGVADRSARAWLGLKDLLRPALI